MSYGGRLNNESDDNTKVSAEWRLVYGKNNGYTFFHGADGGIY